jgi:hypothetical protein
VSVAAVESLALNRSVGALEVVVNDWLHTSLDTGDVVTHGIHASLGRVDLDDVLQLCLAALELVFPHLALRLAIFNHQVFGVLSFLEHLLHIA